MSLIAPPGRSPAASDGTWAETAAHLLSAGAISALDRVAGAVVGLSTRRPWLVLLSTLLLTGLAVLSIVGNIGINTDTTDMLSPDLPFRQQAKALSAAFPQRSGTLAIVIDAPTADQADDAAAALAAALREQLVFTTVFDRASDPFFRANGLLYLDTDRLHALTDQLAAAQPFLATLAREPSLAALTDLLADAIKEADRSEEAAAAFDMRFVLTRIAAVIEAAATGEPRRLSWRSMLAGRPDAADDRRRIVLTKPVRDHGSLQPAKEGIRAIRAAVTALGLDAEPGLLVRLTGTTALADEELRSVRDGIGIAGTVSMILVSGLLLIGLRSIRLAFATLATLVLGLVWTAGFAALTVGDLNLISVAFAVLFIGLGVDFGIHFGLRYREGLRQGLDRPSALIAAGRGCGGSLSLCAVAAAIGFFSFLPTDYVGLAELGLISGSSMFIALFANLSVLPALICLVRPTAGVASRRADPDVPVPAPKPRSRRGSGAIAATAIIVGAAAVPVAMETRFDFDPLNLKDPNTESVSATFDLMRDSDTTPYIVSVLLENADQAAALARTLEVVPAVARTRSLAGLVPADQDTKIAAIEETAFLMQPLFLAPAVALEPDPAKRRRAWARFTETVATADPKRVAGVAALRKAIHALEADGGVPDLASLEHRLLAGFGGRLDALVNRLEPVPVNLDSLPDDVRSQYLAKDGRVRLDIYPAENVRDRAALERFVAAVRAHAPTATGAPVTILEAGDTVVRAFLEALALSVGLIALLLLVLLRNLRDTVLVFAPLGLAAVLTLAASVLLSMPLNFANVIVLPLLFGLGVAGGIHFVLRERERHDAAAMMRTSTPRAVLLSALTTIGSFGSIALSSHPGTSSMGVLLMVALLMTLPCTLLVLPALMDLLPRRAPD